MYIALFFCHRLSCYTFQCFSHYSLDFPFGAPVHPFIPETLVGFFRTGRFLQVDFIMQIYSGGWTASTALLISFRIDRKPSSNRRFGYSVKSFWCLLVFTIPLALFGVHIKFSLARKPEELLTGGKENEVKLLFFCIMHSKIFQITQTRVDKDNYLNEETLMQGCDSPFDYCAEIDEEERRFHIENLVNEVLPKGMFEFVSEDTIRYLGGADEWKCNFANAVRLKAEGVVPEKVLEWVGPVYQLEKILKNPLDTSYWFYTDAEGVQSYAEQSYEFMRGVLELEPGTLLYIGGVIDYHF